MGRDKEQETRHATRPEEAEIAHSTHTHRSVTCSHIAKTRLDVIYSTNLPAVWLRICLKLIPHQGQFENRLVLNLFEIDLLQWYDGIK